MPKHFDLTGLGRRAAGRCAQSMMNFGSPCTVPCGLTLRLSSPSLGWAGGSCVRSLCSGNDTTEGEKNAAESDKVEMQSNEFLPAKEGESCWLTLCPSGPAFALRSAWFSASGAAPGTQ